MKPELDCKFVVTMVIKDPLLLYRNMRETSRDGDSRDPSSHRIQALIKMASQLTRHRNILSQCKIPQNFKGPAPDPTYHACIAPRLSLSALAKPSYPFFWRRPPAVLSVLPVPKGSPSLGRKKYHLSLHRHLLVV
jgi:hypothetical protein